MAISISPNLFEIPNPLMPPAPPPSPPVKLSHLPMLYYGLIVVGTAAFVLALYNLIVIKWCSNSNRSRELRRENRLFDAGTSRSFENMNLGSVSSFKCSKEEQAAGYECAVCLSVFEEGEDVRKLPKCKHSFHAPCIDMWLYSHSDCPLCRARVELDAVVVNGQAENPRDTGEPV